MNVKLRRALGASLAGAVVTVIAVLTRPAVESYAPSRMAGEWAARLVEEVAPGGRTPTTSAILSGTIRLAPPPDPYPTRTIPPPPGSRATLDFASFGFMSEEPLNSAVEVHEFAHGLVELWLPTDHVVMRGRESGDRIYGRWWHELHSGGGSGTFTLRRTGK